MVKDHPIFSLFVSGSSTGCANPFSVPSAIAMCLWNRGVDASLVGILVVSVTGPHASHTGLPVYNKLMDPIALRDLQ